MKHEREKMNGESHEERIIGMREKNTKKIGERNIVKKVRKEVNVIKEGEMTVEEVKKDKYGERMWSTEEGEE